MQEYFTTTNLRHRVLRQSVGMLQRCFWRTDKLRVHYGTSKPSHSKAHGKPNSKPFAYFKMMTIMSTYISLLRQQVVALVDQTVDEAR
jgi:hypothetical protein